MYKSIQTIALVALSSVVSGCATSVYQIWGKQLAEMPSRYARVEDVSMLIGAAPARCDPVASPQPIVGVFPDSEKSVVASVMPNSPAYQAGIRPGDKIVSINRAYPVVTDAHWR